MWRGGALEPACWPRPKRPPAFSSVSLPAVHLLDDGFQHRQLHRDVDILLLDGRDWVKDGLLPAGNLREPVAAARRATVIAIPKRRTGLKSLRPPCAPGDSRAGLAASPQDGGSGCRRSGRGLLRYPPAQSSSLPALKRQACTSRPNRLPRPPIASARRPEAPGDRSPQDAGYSIDHHRERPGPAGDTFSGLPGIAPAQDRPAP